MLETISRHHAAIDRIQVSCRFMEDVVLDTGIDPSKVFRIPIGINRTYFTPATDETRSSVRKKLGIPMDAVVIGSFQKDGEGWKEGLTPKLIKGPDIFLETVAILKRSVPELHVLLTGPARGYIRHGLEKLNIPYVHRLLDDYTEIGTHYRALDLYIVSSRDEGGPKAVLESMACGVPLVSTKVGQATDLVDHGENGFLVDVGDAEALAHYSLQVLDDRGQRTNVIRNGFATAEANDYRNQIPLWASFMKGFVNC
ncbi:glycosyl transferase family 1 [Prosthecochloris sp. GSB1]|nr:glycosyl transferase family 1 [Prosthecochloris sp. GSB1]